MRAAPVSALAMGLALSGCGGGSGGLTSTPGPSVTYVKIADMTGDRTFQSAGIQYTTSATPGFNNATTQAFGSGVTVAYTASSDTYKLTAPDGTTASFGPADAVAPGPTTPPNTQQWLRLNGNVRDSLFLIVPTVSGVALSYTILGSWGQLSTATAQSQNRLAVGGVPTIASDMPRTGSATYATAVGGAAAQGTTNYTLNANSSATFSANFAANSVTTSLTLAGTALPNGAAVVPFGTFNGDGTISTSGPGFTGTLTGTGTTGAFSGAFFGPKALELGYDWFLSGGNLSAVGTVTGVKQ